MGGSRSDEALIASASHGCLFKKTHNGSLKKLLINTSGDLDNRVRRAAASERPQVAEARGGCASRNRPTRDIRATHDALTGK